MNSNWNFVVKQRLEFPRNLSEFGLILRLHVNFNKNSHIFRYFLNRIHIKNKPIFIFTSIELFAKFFYFEESSTTGSKTATVINPDPEVMKIKFFDEDNHVFYTKELLPLECMVKVESVRNISYDKNGSPVFICCALENTATVFKQLANHLKRPVYGLQCTIDAPYENVSTLARFFIDKVKAIQPKGPYNMAGYSYGASVAYEMIYQLENSGEKACFIAIDGSPEYVTFQLDKLLTKINDSTNLDSQVLSYFGVLFANVEFVSTMQELVKEATFEDRVKKIASILHAKTGESLDRVSIRFFFFLLKIKGSR